MGREVAPRHRPLGDGAAQAQSGACGVSGPRGLQERPSAGPLGPGGPFLGPQSAFAPSVEGQCGPHRPGTGAAQPAGPKAGPVGPGQRPAPAALWAPGRPRRRTRRGRIRGAGPALQVGPSPSPGRGRGSRAAPARSPQPLPRHPSLRRSPGRPRGRGDPLRRPLTCGVPG